MFMKMVVRVNFIIRMGCCQCVKAEKECIGTTEHYKDIEENVENICEITRLYAVKIYKDHMPVKELEESVINEETSKEPCPMLLALPEAQSENSLNSWKVCSESVECEGVESLKIFKNF